MAALEQKKMKKQLQRTRWKQQLYFLNAIANINLNYLVNPFIGNEEKKKKKAGDKLYKQANKINAVLANQTVIDFMGTWELVWGPYISFSNAKDLFGKGNNAWATDNTVYMAKLVNRPTSDTNKELPDYFVGVAGTNPASPYGWFIEDFDVEESVVWPPDNLRLGTASTNAIQIAKGTALGLSRIWHMGTAKAPPSGKNPLEVGYRPESGQALWEYIKEHVAEDKTIMVGGHSLGGALSPTLATALADKMNAIGHKVKMAAFPTAGPTPGNEAFADHIASVLDSYHAIYNEVDLIPQAWEQEALTKVSGFYANCGFDGFPLTPNNQLVVKFIDWAKSKPNMTYQRKPSTHRDNFVVETWDNACIAVDKEKNAKGKLLSKTLPKSIKELYDVISEIKEIRDDLSAIHGSELDFSKASTEELVKGFFGFLMYAGSQHTIVYASEREKGLQLPDAVVAVYMKKLKKNKIKSALDGEHALKKLFKQVADHYRVANDTIA